LKQSHDHGDLHSLSWLPPIYMQLGQRGRSEDALATFSTIVESHGVAPLVFIDTVLSVVRDSDGWDNLERLLAPIDKALPLVEARYAPRSPDSTPMVPLVRASRAAARAIAAARRHDVVTAEQQRTELEAAREAAAKLAPGYAARPAYQTAARATLLRVDAEIAVTQGNVAAAEDMFRQALPLEAAVLASDGAYPGRASSCERLGELALAAGRALEAADRFACALEQTPGRSRTLRLAALAADRKGDSARAADFWQSLARNWARADADFTGLAELRAHAR
jgi:hypothetical protein